jgi:hypothetical protein
MQTKLRGDKVVKKQGLGGGICKGLFVAFMKGDSLRLGWSLCNTAKADVFDENRAMDIAVGRAEKNEEFDYPPSMRKKAVKFIKRANAYFKKGADKL